MNISLNSVEIDKAITAYVGSLGVNLTDKQVTITMFAGRKDNGFKADVEITEATNTVYIPTTLVDIERVEQQLELPIGCPTSRLEPEVEIPPNALDDIPVSKSLFS